MQDEIQFIYSPLQQAVNFGIADIDAGRFRSFDTPEVLIQHLQKLAEDIFALENTAPSVRDVSGTRN